MAMHKLFMDDFYDESFKLIAVHCNLEDYRLAYLLNKSLNLKLKRCQDDLDFEYFKSSYAIYEWENNSEYVTWHLVANICKKEEDSLYSSGTLFQNSQRVLKTFNLIPEYKNVDYFIKISNEISNLNDKVVLNKINRIPQIITSYSVDPTKLKSKDYLIF